MRKYFADTYALIEINKNNPSYKRYEDAHIITGTFNILEFGYWLKRTGQQVTELLASLWKMKTAPTLRAAYKSIELKHRLRTKRVSYVDCMGYAMADEMGILFLTGDKQFKDLPNVEFVR